jgi:hypothetical protein
MARKRKSGRRRRGQDADRSVRERLLEAEYTFFNFLGIAVLGVLGVILGFAVFSDVRTIAAFASVFFFLWAAIVLPLDDLQEAGEYLKSDDFGRDVQSFLQQILPWRDSSRGPGRGRGQTSTLALALAGAVVLSTVVAGVTLVPPVAATDTSGCQTQVTHDAYLTSNATINEFNATGNASTIRENTKVTVEKTDAFYRVRGENPNGYCVKITVKIDERVMPPAELGNISAVSGDSTAYWHEVTNFETQSAHTEVTFTLKPNSTAVFAPSRPKVVLPAWRDEHKRRVNEIISRFTGYTPFEDKDLEQRTYQFSADGNSSYVTVPLTNPDTNQSITEWKAVYRVDEDEPWRPVDTDSEDPVFYRDLENQDKLQFVFNDKSATVEFVANPTTVDTIHWDVRSFRRSLHDILEFDLFGAVVVPMPLPEAGQGVTA